MFSRPSPFPKYKGDKHGANTKNLEFLFQLQTLTSLCVEVTKFIFILSRSF